MSDDHFGTREEMIDRYRDLQAQLAAMTRERDELVTTMREERDYCRRYHCSAYDLSQAKAALAQAERRGMERAAKLCLSEIDESASCSWNDACKTCHDDILSEAGKLT